MRRSVSKFGIVLDIDGVLLRGKKPISGAPEALKLLHQRGIPHLFLTNGGGCLEHEKARELSQILDVPISPSQVILSHTPMQRLVQKYHQRPVLVMGSMKVPQIAASYGFAKILTIPDLLHAEPTSYPFGPVVPQRPRLFPEEPIAAIVIMYDPIDWAPELQLAVDVLVGGQVLGSKSGQKSQTPLYVSNQDFTFSGEYDVPRFAQGAFVTCLESLYGKLTGRALEYEAFGKPTANTYEYAEARLHDVAQRKLERIYGIGDNPASDIQGANHAGKHWRSVLVETGIFSPGDDDDLYHRPDIQTRSIKEALEVILDREENQN